MHFVYHQAFDHKSTQFKLIIQQLLFFGDDHLFCDSNLYKKATIEACYNQIIKFFERPLPPWNKVQGFISTKMSGTSKQYNLQGIFARVSGIKGEIKVCAARLVKKGSYWEYTDRRSTKNKESNNIRKSLFNQFGKYFQSRIMNGHSLLFERVFGMAQYNVLLILTIIILWFLKYRTASVGTPAYY